MTEVVAVEPEPTLRAAAEEAAADAPVPVRVVAGTADRLSVDDASADAAVASLVLCSVPDQRHALAELRRVLRPHSELRFYEHVIGGRTWRRIERGFGRFERDIRVPKGLEPDSIDASLADGVLTLRIRKPEPLKPRRIEIGTGRSDEGQPQLEGASA